MPREVNHVLQRFIQMLDDNDLDAVIYPTHGSDPTTIGAFTPDFSKLWITCNLLNTICIALAGTRCGLYWTSQWH